MITLEELRPGDVIFPTIDGYAGILVGAGQILLGDATKEEWKVRHVAMVTQAQRVGSLPHIVQAMPHGAEEVQLSPESFASGFPILRPHYYEQGGVFSDPPYPAQSYDAAESARRYIGVPYSFLDYAAIAGRHALAMQPTKRTPFDNYITTTGHMICSQLVDQALTDTDYHVFDDGRIPQDVTPAALYRKLKTMPGTLTLR